MLRLANWCTSKGFLSPVSPPPFIKAPPPFLSMARPLPARTTYATDLEPVNVHFKNLLGGFEFKPFFFNRGCCSDCDKRSVGFFSSGQLRRYQDDHISVSKPADLSALSSRDSDDSKNISLEIHFATSDDLCSLNIGYRIRKQSKLPS